MFFNNITPQSSSFPLFFDNADSLNTDEKEIKFVPPDDERAGSICAERYAESLVPFTEDCRRCIQQLIKILGDYKQSELLSIGLAKMLPGLPVNIVMAADSLYIAITERRHIDSALLHALGLATACLPDNLNMISRLAGYLRETIGSLTGASFLEADEESHTSGYLFTALAVTALAARYWITDNSAPQRGLLRLPAYMANLMVRAGQYWQALGYMAQNGFYPQAPASPIPAFEVDTCVETAQTRCVETAGEGMASISKPLITAFLSNSTAQFDGLTTATVLNRPVMARGENLGIADTAHALATQKLKQASGLSQLLYCNTRRTITRQNQSNCLITHTHVNTRCDATLHPPPWAKTAVSGPALARPFAPTTELPAIRRDNKPTLIVQGADPAVENVGILNQVADTLLKAGRFIHHFRPFKSLLAAAAPLERRHDTPVSAKMAPRSARNNRHRLHLPRAVRKANKRIIRHLCRKKRLQPNAVSRETLLAALAGYLFDANKGGIAGHAKEVNIISRHILAAAGLYGGKRHEIISLERAETVIRYWVFNNILGMGLEDYVARNVAGDAYPYYFTLSSIHHLLSLQELHNQKLLNLTNIPNQRWGDFNAMWFSFLIKEMPVLRFEEKSIQGFTLGDYRFASLYTGARFLEELGITTYTRKEAIQTGKKMWKLACDEGITEDKMVFFQGPALFFKAMLSPESVNRERHSSGLKIEALNDYIQYRKMIEALHQDLTHKYEDYHSSVKQWLSKGALAEEIIARCPTAELPFLPDLADSIRTKQQRREKAVLSAKQIYMNAVAKPCDSAPESLSDEYQKLTAEVADRFYDLDKLLVHLAFNALPKEEYAALFASGTVIRPVLLKMRTDRQVYVLYGDLLDINVDVELRFTDLISVNRDGDEWIYALRGGRGNNTEGYNLIRVDRDIRKYIEAGLINYDFGGDYTITEGKVDSHKEKFNYSIRTDNSRMLSTGDSEDTLVDYLSNLHRDSLYRYLHESGNDKSDLQKIWNVAKHFIPFYDCVEGIIDHKPVEAAQSCLMDVVSFLPVFGQAARLSGKFGVGLARGLRSGKMALDVGSFALGAKSVLREIRLPILSELSSLGKSTLRSIDPGFELGLRLSKKWGNKLLSRLSSDKSTADLARGIASSEVIAKLPVAPRGGVKTALLPHTTIKVPVKVVGRKGGQDIYVRIHPETGEAFGKRYLLIKGRLKPVKKEYYASNQAFKFTNNPCALGRFKRNLDNVCKVKPGEWKTADDPFSLLSTRGLADCSALAVLSGWNGKYYQHRVLIHLQGSDVTYGLKRVDASEFIYDWQEQLRKGGGKVIFVGGTNSESNAGLSLIIGQSHFSGTKPLLDLMNMPGVSKKLAGSNGIIIRPDGTFTLKEGNGSRGLLTNEQTRAVLADANDELF